MGQSATQEAASAVPSAAASPKGNDNSSPGTATPTSPSPPSQGEPEVRVQVLRQRRLNKGNPGEARFYYDCEIEVDGKRHRADFVPTRDLTDPKRFRDAVLDRCKVA